MDARQRLDAERLEAAFVDDHDAGGAVADLAGAGRRVLAVLGDQLDALDAVEAGIEADALVDVVGVGRVVGAGDLQRNDLVLELAGLGRGNRALVAPRRNRSSSWSLESSYFSAIISAPVNWLNMMFGYFFSRPGLL